MNINAESVTRLICTTHPEWNEEFGEDYITDQVQAVMAGTSDPAPRGKKAEETDVSMIAQALALLTNAILNLFSILERIEAKQDRIAAIKKEVANWDTERKEALIEALLEELD